MTLLGLLTGARFRPPAELLLQHLPTGTEVELRPEPENPYDPEAVGVWVEPRQIPESEHQALAEELPGAGWTLPDLLSAEPIQLGYIATESGKPFQGFTERNPEVALQPSRAFASACSGRLEWTNFGQDVLVRSEEEPS